MKDPLLTLTLFHIHPCLEANKAFLENELSQNITQYREFIGDIVFTSFIKLVLRAKWIKLLKVIGK